MSETHWEEILRPDNLLRAYKAVKRNRGAAGVDGIGVDELGDHLRQHWAGVKRKLIEGRYQPGAIKGVSIPKSGGGVRLLGIPNTQDRLIQQAILQVLSDEFDPHFSDSSHGYRPGRCAADAVKSAQGYVQAGHDWVVDIDISAFFDNVNHDILMRLVALRVRDKPLLKLIGRILRADLRLGHERHARSKGTPQGGPLSPLLANIYLDELDKELEQRGLKFARYADDLSIYVQSERSAERVLETVSRWLERHLRLTVNTEKSGTGKPWQRKFLGFHIDREGEIKIAPSSIENYKQRVRAAWNAQQSRKLEDVVKGWRRFVRGWWNYFGISTNRLSVESGWTRRHIRKYFWQRWKSAQGRRTQLSKLGVSAKARARVDYYASAWRAARHPAMHAALSNAVLKRYGLWTPNDLSRGCA